MAREALHYPDHADGFIGLHQRANRHWTSHCHDELEANLVLSGTGSYAMDHRRYDLRPGTIVWLFPDQEHHLIEESRDLVMWIVVGHRRALPETLHEPMNRTLLQADPPGEHCRQVPAGVARDLDRELKRLFKDRDRPDQFNAGLRLALLRLWRAYLGGDAITPDTLHPAVQRALQRLREPDCPALPELAAQCGVGYQRLADVFKAQVGCSMRQWRSRALLEAFLLRHDWQGEHTVLADALAVGFGSYAQFHRVFSDVLGVGPRAWRQRVLADDAQGS